jgi:hypothetical protein
MIHNKQTCKSGSLEGKKANGKRKNNLGFHDKSSIYKRINRASLSESLRFLERNEKSQKKHLQHKSGLCVSRRTMTASVFQYSISNESL